MFTNTVMNDVSVITFVRVIPIRNAFNEYVRKAKGSPNSLYPKKELAESHTRFDLTAILKKAG